MGSDTEQNSRWRTTPTIRRISEHIGHVNALHDAIFKPGNEVFDEVVNGILSHALDMDEDVSSSEGYVRISTGKMFEGDYHIRENRERGMKSLTYPVGPV